MAGKDLLNKGYAIEGEIIGNIFQNKGLLEEAK